MLVLAARVFGSTLSVIGFTMGAANAVVAAPWYQSWAPMIVSLTGVATLMWSVFRDSRDRRERRTRRSRRGDRR